jgi:hypothetical protein
MLYNHEYGCGNYLFVCRAFNATWSVSIGKLLDYASRTQPCCKDGNGTVLIMPNMGDSVVKLVSIHFSCLVLNYRTYHSARVMNLAWMDRSDLAWALFGLVVDLFKPRVSKQVEPRGKTSQEGT